MHYIMQKNMVGTYLIHIAARLKVCLVIRGRVVRHVYVNVYTGLLAKT